MTEFEAATLAVQQATLAVQQGSLELQQASLAVQQGNLELQQASLALQQSQLWAAIAIPVVAGLVGAGQCALIWLGLRRMDQANRVRLAEAEARERRDDAREKREDARHAEAMTRLDQQAEALRALVQGLERQGAALEAALKGGRA